MGADYKRVRQSVDDSIHWEKRRKNSGVDSRVFVDWSLLCPSPFISRFTISCSWGFVSWPWNSSTWSKSIGLVRASNQIYKTTLQFLKLKLTANGLFKTVRCNIPRLLITRDQDGFQKQEIFAANLKPALTYAIQINLASNLQSLKSKFSSVLDFEFASFTLAAAFCCAALSLRPVIQKLKDK